MVRAKMCKCEHTTDFHSWNYSTKKHIICYKCRCRKFIPKYKKKLNSHKKQKMNNNNDKLILEALGFLLENSELKWEFPYSKGDLKDRIEQALSQTTDNVNEELLQEVRDEEEK